MLMPFQWKTLRRVTPYKGHSYKDHTLLNFDPFCKIKHRKGGVNKCYLFKFKGFW